MYFTGTDDVHGSQVWKSDGTAAVTTLVKQTNPGLAGGSHPEHLLLAENALYFTAGDTNFMWHILKSDGAEAGTTMLSADSFTNVQESAAAGT